MNFCYTQLIDFQYFDIVFSKPAETKKMVYKTNDWIVSTLMAFKLLISSNTFSSMVTCKLLVLPLWREIKMRPGLQCKSHKTDFVRERNEFLSFPVHVLNKSSGTR